MNKNNLKRIVALMSAMTTIMSFNSCSESNEKGEDDYQSQISTFDINKVENNGVIDPTIMVDLQDSKYGILRYLEECDFSNGYVPYDSSKLSSKYLTVVNDEQMQTIHDFCYNYFKYTQVKDNKEEAKQAINSMMEQIAKFGSYRNTLMKLLPNNVSISKDNEMFLDENGKGIDPLCSLLPFMGDTLFDYNKLMLITIRQTLYGKGNASNEVVDFDAMVSAIGEYTSKKLIIIKDKNNKSFLTNVDMFNEVMVSDYGFEILDGQGLLKSINVKMENDNKFDVYMNGQYFYTIKSEKLVNSLKDLAERLKKANGEININYNILKNNNLLYDVCASQVMVNSLDNKKKVMI